MRLGSLGDFLWSYNLFSGELRILPAAENEMSVPMEGMLRRGVLPFTGI